MDKLMTKTDVAEWLNVHRNTVDNLRASDPTFPQPLQLPGRLLRWSPDQLAAWAGAAPAPRVGQRKSAAEYLA